MNSFLKKFIVFCFFIFSRDILIAMDAQMPENDEKKQIEYLKEHSEKIDEILAKKKWFHDCCFPSRTISLAEQAREELRLDQIVIKAFNAQKINQYIQKFKPYEFNWLDENQIKLIQSNNFTPKIIGLFNLEMMNNITNDQFAGLKTDQVQNLIDRYQSLIDGNDSLKHEKLVEFINKFKIHTQNESVINQLNAIQTKLLYNLIKTNQASSQELANLTPDQVTDLITYYQDKIQNAHHANYNDFLNFINELEKNSTSQAVISEINRLKINFIYSNLTDDDITNSEVFTKAHLTEFLSKLENFDLNHLMKHNKSNILKKIVKKQLNLNFSKNIPQFPAEYIKYVDASSLEPFDIDYLETDQIKALTKKQITMLEQDQLEALSSDQVKALTKKQIQALSDDQLKILYNHKSLSFFSKEQIEALTLDQIENLSMPLLDKLNPEQVGFFSPQQVQGFKPSWFKELTFNTFNFLTEDQLKACNKEQIESILQRIKDLLSITKMNDFKQAFAITQSILNKIIKSHQSSAKFIKLTNNFYLSVYKELDSSKFALLSDENRRSMIKFMSNLDMIKFTSFMSSCFSDKIFEITVSIFKEKLLDPYDDEKIKVFTQNTQAFKSFLNSLKENRLHALLLSFGDYSLEELNTIDLNNLINVYTFYKGLHTKFIDSLTIKPTKEQKYFIPNNIYQAFIDKFKKMNLTELSNFIKKSDPTLSSIAYDVYHIFKKSALN